MQNAVRYGEKVGNTLKQHKGKVEVKMLNYLCIAPWPVAIPTAVGRRGWRIISY
jgi:hypothetical protein